MKESVREFLNKVKKEKGFLTGSPTPKAEARRKACEKYRKTLDEPPVTSALYNQILRRVEQSNKILTRHETRNSELSKPNENKNFKTSFGGSDPLASGLI